MRRKYVTEITIHLLNYIENSGHFKTKKMSKVATKLVKKCGEIGFPLGTFSFGNNYVCNRNASWIGYEFKIDDDGLFYVKDSINNKKIEKRENCNFECTQFIEIDIDDFDFNKLYSEYYLIMKKSDY